MKIFHQISELVGGTPLMELKNYASNRKLNARLLAKLECFNPAGSAKDRVALQMLTEAEASGAIRPGSTIIEPTSGNTGIGLAAMAVSRGYRVILTMPDTMSRERRMLLKTYGAELVLTDGAKGMAGAIEKAGELAGEIPNSWIAGQFVNPANPRAHELTTGPEIWADTDGTVDLFVAGAGTGGTITGVGRFLKTKNPKVKIVAVEPENSAVLSGGQPGSHGLQGIGAGFVPEIMDVNLFDEILPVSDADAYAAGRALVREEGLLVGITSGAAVHAAAVLASRPENASKTIVALLPDSGERYLSTPMFAM